MCDLLHFFWLKLEYFIFLPIKNNLMQFDNIINTLKKRRENLKVSQENLSKLSGVGLRTIKQFESGKGNPTLQTIQKIANVLGLEICLKVKTQLIDEESKNTL
jgi:transcriptional regulator with XRE-family HTH domain